MSRLFPFQSTEDTSDPESRLLRIDDEAADEVFDTLSSQTAREILTALCEEPRTVSELAEAADTSLQNVKYHLDKFESVDLVEPVGTVYSEKGREMTTYGPVYSPLVLTAGRDEQTSSLRGFLKRLFGGLSLLALSSVLVDRALRAGFLNRRPRTPPSDTQTDTPSEVPNPSEVPGTDFVNNSLTVTPTETPAQTLASTPMQPKRLIDVPPGIVFFAGGAFVLLLLAGWYLIHR
jgi:DNA-binding transcriptional ArsR family regulator